ncbi:MAG TPA: hypothetical protein VGR14_19495 [Verrucomicrobiae bacterium]|nr:hypothetical protein [Verrucomicrobiae bacterium]
MRLSATGLTNRRWLGSNCVKTTQLPGGLKGFEQKVTKVLCLVGSARCCADLDAAETGQHMIGPLCGLRRPYLGATECD